MFPFIIAFICQEELAFPPMHVILIFSLSPSSCSEDPSAATKSFIRTALLLHSFKNYYGNDRKEPNPKALRSPISELQVLTEVTVRVIGFFVHSESETWAYLSLLTLLDDEQHPLSQKQHPKN